jgi:hypothetical protein
MILILPIVILDGVMASVHIIGSKVCSLVLAKDDGLLRAIKIHSKPSFGGGWSSHVVIFYGMLKILLKCERRYFVRPNLSFPSPSSSCFATRWPLVGLPENSGGQIMGFPC